jgi:hypothetical protein
MKTNHLQLTLFLILLIAGIIVGVINLVVKYLPDWFIELTLAVESIGLAALLLWIIMFRKPKI